MFNSAVKKCTSFLDTLGHRIAIILQSKYFLGAAFAWFLLQTVLISLAIKLNLPPDESHHTLFIKYLAEKNFNIFAEQTDSFGLGELEREISFLYHWLLSPLHATLSSLGNTTVYIFRFISIALGLGSLVMLKKIGDQLQIPKLVTHFSVFAMASTLMFVFLSSAVNYDNLVILLSLSSLFVLILLLEKFSLWRLLAFAVLVAFGSLVKFSFLPLALFIGLAAVWQMYKERRRLKHHWEELLRRKRWPVIVLGVILFALLGLGIERIGVNIVAYGSHNPACTEFHTVSECENYDVFRRRQKFGSKDIDQSKLLNIVEFTPRWAMENVPAIYGIYAHKMLTLPSRLTMPIVIFMVFAGMAVIRKTDIRREPIVALLLAISVAYAGVVMVHNYSIAYTNTGVFGHALQGRYIFPVLPLLYLIGFYSLYKWLPRASVYIFTLAMVPLVLASAPALFALTNPEWYTPFGEKLFYHTDSVRYATDLILKLIK